MSKMIEKARRYEREESQKITRDKRPIYHFSNPIGWMNDPNGFSDYKGEHHLFFQYYPYATHWDSMHWGHAKSNDFIRWEYLPIALAPDQCYDNFGVFSGSAIEDGENQILIYTGVERKVTEKGENRIRQNQCIAIGNGINYEKVENNPVVTADMLPIGSSQEDFRDPKIWKQDDKFFMVVGSRHSDGSGQIALFCSEKLEKWEFIGILDRSENKIGTMWECPDFYPLDGKQILMISPQEMEAKGLEFHNGNNTVFLIGNYDKEKFKFTREKVQSIDYGLDFYAPQTMETDDGRRIMIGWMQSWDNPMYPDNQLYSGMMTIPRELSIKEERVCQLPVRELEKYRKNVIKHDRICIQEETECKGICGRSIDLQLTLKGNEYDKFKMKLAADDKYYSEIIYDKDEKTLTFDRTHSGLKKDTLCTRSMFVSEKEDMLYLRILIDSFSVEIFVNDGEQVMSSLIYTPISASKISFQSNGKTYVDITKYDIEVK